MAAWRATYTAFGAKPSRTRNSAGASARRALTGAGLSRINSLVDLCAPVPAAEAQAAALEPAGPQEKFSPGAGTEVQPPFPAATPA
jgi:hypothetical protein